MDHAFKTRRSFATIAITVLLVPAVAGAAGLSRPLNLVATAVSTSAVDLTWDDRSSAETAFAIERSLRAGSGFAEIIRTAANATTHRDTGLSGGVTYYYRVRAIGDGASLFSPVASATTPTADVTPPSVPTGVTATAAGCDQIAVSWQASFDAGSGVMAYNVFRNGTFFRQVTAPGTSTTDTGRTGSTTYTYAVTAVDHAGNQSAVSPSATATTPACADTVAPSVPTGVKAVVFGCTRVDVVWNASTDTGPAGLKGYKIYRNGVFIRGVYVPAVSTSDTTVLPSSTYSYAVSAIDNANNESAKTPVVGATTPACPGTTTTTTTRPPTTTTTVPRDTTPPPPPGGLVATALNCSQIRLTWNAATDTGGSGTKGYNIFRNGVFIRMVLAPTTTSTDTGLAASTVYSYSVSAVDNANNQSGRSLTASANTPACPDTTAPSAPTGITASAVSCSQIDVGWNAATDTGGSGLKSYRVFRNGSFVREVAVPTTSMSDTGLVASTSYSYTVTALDNAGNQSATSVAVSRATPACGTANPSLVGFVPGIGAAKDVVLGASGTAYVASMEFGLAVVNLATPSQPVAIGDANPPFYAERVAVSGSLAAVTGNSAGLRVVDISTPAAPRTVGTLAGTLPGVAMNGQFAYVLQVVPGNPSHTDLVVVDLRTPSAPTIVGRVTLAGGADIKLVGSLAYVAAGTGGLQVVDVTTPTAPRIVGTFNTAGSARAVSIANGFAYVADDTAIVVVNVSNPAQPSLRGSLATSAFALTVVGTRLYAIGGTQFKIVDVGNPAAPTLLGATEAYSAQRLAVSGNVAYLASPDVDASRNQGGLYAFDVSVPSNPRVLSNNHGRFDNTGIAAAGSLAVLTGNSLGLKVLDLAGTAPRVVGSMAGTLIGVSMAGQFAHALLVVPGNPSHVDLVVIDLRTPSAPSIVGRVTLPGGLGIETVGTLAYVAAGTAGLRVVDVSTPAAPRIVGSVDTPGTAHSVAVTNGFAYVGDETSLVAIDVASPTHPVVRGSLPTAATWVAVAGARLAVLDGLHLKMINIATPAAPALLSTSDGLAAQGGRALGNLLFLATPALNHFDTLGGVHVLDVANPSQPRVVKQIIVPGTTRVVTAVGTTVYAGDSASLVDVIR